VLQPLVDGHAGRRGLLLRLGGRRLLLPRAAAVPLHLRRDYTRIGPTVPLLCSGYLFSPVKLVKMARTEKGRDAHGRSLDVAKQRRGAR
jgi:hypothetical protein